MVHRIETTGTIAPDGSLTIDRTLSVPPGKHRVVLFIDEASEDLEPLDWPSFVKTTYGSLSDVPITREPEGNYEQREALE